MSALSFDKSRSPDLSEVAYFQLRTLIVDGRLAPGSILSENDLARRLHLSRTPVRAALTRLQQEGFVKMQARSCMVSPLTADDMRELFLIAGAIEGIAVRVTAGLPEKQRIDIADRMQKINTDIRAALRQDPPAVSKAAELHVQFHQLCVKSGGGPRLQQQIEAIQPQVERYERQYTMSLNIDVELALKEHDQIISAVRAGDCDAAEAAVVLNWRKGVERYEKVIRASGERGIW